MASDAGADLDGLRARVVADGLVGEAVAALTPVVSGLALDALGPVKQLLKRFFSDAAWTADDDDALAAAVGGGGGADRVPGRVVLAPGVVLVWGWTEDRFGMRLVSDTSAS